MELDSLTTGEKVTIAGAVLAAIGTFLPWMTASVFGSTVNVQGIDGDGVYVLALGAVAISIVVLRDWGRTDRIGVIVCGLLMTLVSGMYVVDPATGLSGEGAEFARQLVNPGIGLYLSALGSLGTLVGGVMGLSSDEQVQTPATDRQ